MNTIDPAAIEARLDRATKTLSEERRRVTDELDALQAFTDHVKNSKPEQAQPATVAPAVNLSVSKSNETLETVRAAYESTFMSTPHYDEDYDEPYVQSLAVEFGPEIAAALVGGEQFTQACKEGLLDAVEEAVTRRELLVDALADEESSLSEAQSVLLPLSQELAEIRRSSRANRQMGILDAHDARLTVLAEKCDRLLERRQATIVEQRRTLTLPIDELDLPSYVYTDVEREKRYPVLGTLAECIQMLDELQNDVQAALEQQGQSTPS
ncbi:hypothetical protein ACFQJ7_10365 [Halovenus rubra]|uniref:DUF7260 domain-containing protein n=2 Tax=Halovenus rubra TaxID=869890 RepID=A0ABD5X993_9EURY|nr:hypothetical protein [Halovenus rubra]